MKDLGGIGEAAVDVSAGDTDLLYSSLGCDLHLLDPATVEHSIVAKLVASPKIVIKGVYRLRRAQETVRGSEKMTNQRMLLHGSKAQNIIGILARGLRLPDVVVSSFGVSRTNSGNLGAGLYFSDSAETAAVYTSPLLCPEAAPSRFLLVARVALGKPFITHKPIPGLRDAPDGFDSVHWVKDSGSEFCVYSESLHQLQYLVEFTMLEDFKIAHAPLVMLESQDVLRQIGLVKQTAVDTSRGVVAKAEQQQQKTLP
jgi:poly [ADP-ribose] polymerase